MKSVKLLGMTCERCGWRENISDLEKSAWCEIGVVRPTNVRAFGIEKIVQESHCYTVCPECGRQARKIWNEHNEKLIAWFEEGVKNQGEGGLA